MIKVYINYPNQGIFSIYEDIEHKNIQKNTKVNQRVLSINSSNFTEKMLSFIDNYKFSATSAENDLWIDIDTGDTIFDKNIAFEILKKLSEKYVPFQNNITFKKF